MHSLEKFFRLTLDESNRLDLRGFLLIILPINDKLSATISPQLGGSLLVYYFNYPINKRLDLTQGPSF